MREVIEVERWRMGSRICGQCEQPFADGVSTIGLSEEEEVVGGPEDRLTLSMDL
ncbi:MAG: hypothetical protein ACI8T1_002573 [Verrucomicrobiales bacterium]|jgi:hypothetical protein